MKVNGEVRESHGRQGGDREGIGEGSRVNKTGSTHVMKDARRCGLDVKSIAALQSFWG